MLLLCCIVLGRSCIRFIPHLSFDESTTEPKLLSQPPSLSQTDIVLQFNLIDTIIMVNYNFNLVFVIVL